MLKISIPRTIRQFHNIVFSRWCFLGSAGQVNTMALVVNTLPGKAEKNIDRSFVPFVFYVRSRKLREREKATREKAKEERERFKALEIHIQWLIFTGVLSHPALLCWGYSPQLYTSYSFSFFIFTCAWWGHVSMHTLRIWVYKCSHIPMKSWSWCWNHPRLFFDSTHSTRAFP